MSVQINISEIIDDEEKEVEDSNYINAEEKENSQEANGISGENMENDKIAEIDERKCDFLVIFSQFLMTSYLVL